MKKENITIWRFQTNFKFFLCLQKYTILNDNNKYIFCLLVCFCLLCLYCKILIYSSFFSFNQFKFLFSSVQVNNCVILHYPRNNDIIQWNWKNWNDFNLWRGWNIFYKHFDYKYPEKNYPTRQNGNQIFLNNQKKNQKNNEWSRITEENAFGKKKCKNTTFSFGS